MNRIMKKIMILTTIFNVKVSCHNENIVNIDFSILEIL